MAKPILIRILTASGSWQTFGTTKFYRPSPLGKCAYCIQVGETFRNLYSVVLKCLFFSDTDSFYALFTGWTYDAVLSKLSDVIDFSNFPKTHKMFSNERKAKFGFVKVDTAEKVVHAFTCERKKSYQLFMNTKVRDVEGLELERKTVKKGCPGGAARKLEDKNIISLLKDPGCLKASFNKFQSKNHSISMINQKKQVTSSFDDSAFYKNCGLCNIPFNCTLSDSEICTSVNCDRNRILSKIWCRVLNK